MKTLKFKCTLLTDVILNAKAASEGPNETLDFISGSTFLGVAANELYKEMNDEALELFHSGKVRFGDAHPLQNSKRTLRTPTAFFYPKLSSIEDECYVYPAIPNPDAEEIRKKQLKQCRGGFCEFGGEKAYLLSLDKQYAVKSAYDNMMRRSKDEQLYCYQSLQKGTEFCFSVEIDKEELADKVKGALEGRRRIGRSRTAQYGLAQITEADYAEVVSLPSDSSWTSVYAESRLIFLDEFGLPTYQPTPEQLGFEKRAEIDWEKTQLRTFCYAPWNFKRQCFDADRCGIEKGSVIVVRLNGTQAPSISTYVGDYRNEGFGRVIYNPSFLHADDKGRSSLEFKDTERKNTVENVTGINPTPLLRYLSVKKHQSELEANVYQLVNQWVTTHREMFHGESFASQWGTIRQIAMQCHTKKELLDELFDKEKEKVKNDGSKDKLPYAYLTHGVAKDKWSQRRRKEEFRKFFDGLTDENARIAVINLAAEMAKKCKEDRR